MVDGLQATIDGGERSSRSILPAEAATSLALTLTQAILLLNNWRDENRARSLRDGVEYTDVHGEIRFAAGKLPRQTDLDTANDRVQRYAPDAPESVKD